MAPRLLEKRVFRMNNDTADVGGLRADVHPFCVVCSASNPFGMALKFAVDEEGMIAASFYPHSCLEGYAGMLHGGMTASLLDGIMTNCLFFEGIIAVTADLRVRYREPVLIGTEILLRARVGERHPPLYVMRAELLQNGSVKAIATAKFMQRPSGEELC